MSNAPEINMSYGDLSDRIHAKLSMLQAQTATIYGEGFEAFNNQNDDVKHNYHWAIAESVDELKEMFKQLTQGVTFEVKATAK